MRLPIGSRPPSGVANLIPPYDKAMGPPRPYGPAGPSHQQRAGQTAPDAAIGTFSLRALLCSGLRRSEPRPALPNMCSHGPARLYVFAGPDPMLEIAVAVALRAARPSSPPCIRHRARPVTAACLQG